MNYDELETRLGNPLGETGSTTSSWDRYPQALRREAIREAERQLAITLPAELMPELFVTATVELDSDFKADLDSLTILPHPMLKIVRIMDGTLRKVNIKQPSEIERMNLFTMRNRNPYCFKVSGNTYQFKYGNDIAHGNADPVMYYIKKPQTMEEFIPGRLEGGTSPLITTWTGVADGAFKITIDGDAEASITGCDFSSAPTMTEVATVIEDKLQAVASGGFTLSTCVWDDEAGRFVITSGSISGITSVSVTSAGAGGTDISGVGAGDYMDCDSGSLFHNIVAGQAAFKYGIIQTQLKGHENALLDYATYYCLKMDDKIEKSAMYLKLSGLATKETAINISHDFRGR